MNMEILLMKQMEKNWFLIISILFIGCINNKNETSISLIPKETFTEILIDVHQDTTVIMEDIDLINHNNKDSIILLDILHRYSYSYDVYDQTISFYIEHPEDFIEILNNVKDSLSF